MGGADGMNIVFVNHGIGKDFAFRVPDELACHIHKGDTVVVETMRGISTGVCRTGIVSGDGALDKAMQDGAYTPLKPVIGKLYPELKAVIMRDMQTAIIEIFTESSDEMPF
jgi:hypothetical protein